MTTQILISSGFAVCSACLILWWDASKRPEYGNRPAIFLASILVLALADIAIIVATFGLGDNLALYYFPAASLVLFLYFAAFFLLEHSVHVQRIYRSFLLDHFVRRLWVLVACAAVVIALLALSAFLFHSMLQADFASLFSSAITAEPKRLESLGKVLGWLYFISCLAIGVGLLYINRLYVFHEGIVRHQKYPFILFTVFLAFMLIAGLLRVEFLKASPFFPFIFLNLLFAARAYHEYFVFRTRHLNDLHAKLEQAEKDRTKLINTVIASTEEEDHTIVKNTLTAGLEASRNVMRVSTHMFASIMAYRKKGDSLQVDSPEMIVNYCVPLTRLDAVKRLNQSELNNLILQKVYRLPELISAGRESFSDFGDAAVKDMIESGDRVIVPIPPFLKGIYRLIVMYPVLNHKDITGFVVLFKTEYDQVFPQEDVIIRNLTANLSIIYSIMGGKQVQEEKNRLSGEMDIARNIQTSIVPGSLSISGYDSACMMSTASEVGGDLYDYFPSPFGNYLDISDVAGHGLPAGMMALIHLSALHGALYTSQILKKELVISELYDVINRVLCSINKQRIGSDKFMTCNVLVEKNGTFTHAGTHLIALLYKKRADQVTELRGMIDKTAFLGLSEYVISKESEGQFSMESGDALLLYTDGAIEAKNQSEEQFGLPRLKEVFKEAAGLAPDDAVKAIMDRVTAFAASGDLKKYAGRLADDVSLVFMRRT